VIKLADIKLVISDVDGVMTDGRLYYNHRGECMKVFNVHDGHGIKMLQSSDVNFAIVSGSKDDHISARARDLGIKRVICNSTNKANEAVWLMNKFGVLPNETACIGDDLLDIPMFGVCGLSFAPANAMKHVLVEAGTVLTKNGGEGVVRELADLIIAAKSSVR
jgi:3-deoxy-D-manno-octulosonate 8-phosphate phosphatase (KDO 8-P phosphatase)